MDYFATGEGRSLMAYIGYAQNADELRKSASEVLSEYYAKGLDVAEGVIENNVTLVVFSAKTFELVRAFDGQASTRCFGLVSFNRS
uniref:hypothetical protein n=1 Tax=Polaromonas sp. H6N TaxID=1840293 RepID=UPI0015E81A4E|nr:hypothetical protein [Polaromonas sp. H6N]